MSSTLWFLLICAVVFAFIWFANRVDQGNHY